MKAWKYLAKNLEMTTTKTNYGPRCEFNFSFGKITTLVLSNSFRVKYFVCSPTKVVLDLIELFPSAVWRSFPSLAARNIYKELDINVCVLNLSSLHFSNDEITMEALMHLFRVWYDQCLAKSSGFRVFVLTLFRDEFSGKSNFRSGK